MKFNFKFLPLRWFNKRQLAKMGLPRCMAKPPWQNRPPEWLLQRLRDEVAELEEACSQRNGVPVFCHGDRITALEAVIDECADVANFACMLAHKIRIEVGELNE